DADEEDF
nr:Chain A, NRP1-CTAD [Arabidopsis thaliana]